MCITLFISLCPEAEGGAYAHEHIRHIRTPICTREWMFALFSCAHDERVLHLHKLTCAHHTCDITLRAGAAQPAHAGAVRECHGHFGADVRTSYM